jgi:hypothetical protein
MAKQPRFMEGFYSPEIHEYTLSCVRDLYKAAVVFACAVVFRLGVALLKAIGFPEWVTKVLNFIDELWSIFVVGFAAFVFIAKLLVRKK